MSYANSISGLTSYDYIVNGTASGPLGTIQEAINKALADGATTAIFIRPGTYVENLTLYSGINLIGSSEGQVIIVGTHKLPVAGLFTAVNCFFSSDTDVFSQADAGTTIVSLENCVFNTGAGFVYNLPNWVGDLFLIHCNDNSASDGIISNAAGAALEILDSTLGSGVVGMAVTGVTAIDNSTISCPISATGNAVIDINGCVINGAISSVTPAVVSVYNTRIVSGATACITTTSTGLTTIEGCVLDSSAAAAIAGTGAIEMGSITFNDVSVIAGTITYDNASLFAASNVNVENILFLAGDAGSAGQVLTSNGPLAPTWQAGGGGSSFTWQGSAGTTMVANNGYIATGNAVRTFALPATAAVGDTYSVASWIGYGASNGWTITVPVTQTAELGTQTATTSLSSTAVGDTITLVCVYAAGGAYSWQATSVIGNITVV